MNAVDHNPSGTLLYEPSIYEPSIDSLEANRLALRTNENLQVFVSTTAEDHLSGVGEMLSFIGPGIQIVSGESLNNGVGRQCSVGTGQPLILGLSDDREPANWFCGDGLIAAAASRQEHMHVAPNWIIEASERLAPSILAFIFYRSPKGPEQLTFSDRILLPSVGAQREEREATAALAKSIEDLLPSYSDAELGALVGVSRLSWRDWRHGNRVIRSKTRRRALRLKRILEIRSEAAPTEPLTEWLDKPVGTDLDVTPARLLNAGQDQTVAILAARSRVPDAVQFGLAEPLDLGGLVTPQLQHHREDEAVVKASYERDDELYGKDATKQQRSRKDR